MPELPEQYAAYLADKDPAFVETVRPILEQSAAGQRHGVHVRFTGGSVQALVDENNPYGTITEGLD
ncbi:hypothetical protein [Sinomonas terrae]|uniref:Uncharacterized protein n=1 Tax=Sinomonas terrae TaxID=2908838 RepID=A0ABS9TWH2_9MICC|nr:hypothetical protein [Sinomonas terrae]MCH6468764.1 hypothetical protein [Sinomonas terrae]HKT59249.1 hypothetical protein [Gemmatimonadales bacterium]